MKIPDQIRTLWTSKVLPYILSLNAKQRFLSVFCCIVLFLWVVKACTDVESSRLEPNVDQPETQVAQIEETDSVAQEPSETKIAEEPVSEKRNWPYYNRPIRTWNDPEFNDLQDVQIAAAMKNGIKHSIVNRAMAEEEVAKGELVFIDANPMFYMDDLQHSIPYLVPKAYRLLNRIGVNFIDSLVHKNLPVHALVVTSVTRTQKDISSLQKMNGNATTNSCHLFATTFDISWRSFKEIGVDPQGGEHSDALEIALKRTLGEVLRDLRYEGRCYVKHEQKQSCFHITVR